MKNSVTAILLWALCVLCLAPAERTAAQAFGTPGGSRFRVLRETDTSRLVQIDAVSVFASDIDLSDYARLVRNVKVAYPIAKEANRMLVEMEAAIDSIDDEGRRREYIRLAERRLIREYTPVLKKMTFSQGKVLIKLIDRETARTSFALVRELRGGFRAGFWQAVARIFGANLKDTYDPTQGEDRIIERIIVLYEAGFL